MSTVQPAQRDIQDAYTIAQIASFLSYQEEETKPDIFFSLPDSSVLQLFTAYIYNQKKKAVSVRVKEKLDRCLKNQSMVVRAFMSRKHIHEQHMHNFGITAPFVKVLQYAENAESFYTGGSSSGVKRGPENLDIPVKTKTQRLIQGKPFNSIEGSEADESRSSDYEDETSTEMVEEDRELILEFNGNAAVEQNINTIEKKKSCQVPFVKKYLALTTKLVSRPSLLLQQRGRHFAEKAQWNCFDNILLKDMGIAPSIVVDRFTTGKKYGINMALLERTLKDDGAYNDMYNKISNLLDGGLVKDLASVDEDSVDSNETVNLKTGVVFTALTTVLSYIPVAASSTSESHCKIQLWAPIFSSAFKTDGSQIQPVWELLHPIPGNGGIGSLVSDFATVAEGLPTFMVEFEVGRQGAHKDDVCLISEAAFEYHQYLSQLNIPLSKLTDVCFHIGYVSDAKIVIDEIHPEYNEESKLLYYRIFPNVANFDLLSVGSGNKQIIQILQLLTFIKTILIPNGNNLLKLLTLSAGLSLLPEFLPTLPTKGAKASKQKGSYTPQKK
ncbi:hypothetical protein BDR26DRAFT_1008657 [Obelidium mucronatum]|nr:hypothetical protein BDR26DRAFT_1008657 [Obelidium mucronatum]